MKEMRNFLILHLIDFTLWALLKFNGNGLGITFGREQETTCLVFSYYTNNVLKVDFKIFR